MPSEGLPKEKHILKELDVDEITICGKGMNADSRVVLFKMADQKETADNEAENIVTKGKKEMTEKTKDDQGKTQESIEEVKKAAATALEKQKEEHKKEMATLTQLALMSDAEKTFMAGLPDEKTQQDFVAKSKDERTAIMKADQEAKDRESQEVLKTDFGEVRKADVGAQVYEITKAFQTRIQLQDEKLDEAVKTNKAMQDEIEMAKLEKRAETEFGNLPGEPKEIAKALKAVGSLDSETQKVLEKMLKAANSSIDSLFEEAGIITDANKSADPEAELQKIADDMLNKNPTWSVAKARNAAMETTKGKDLYKQMRLHKTIQ